MSNIEEKVIRAEQEAYEIERHFHTTVDIYPQTTDADGNVVPDWGNAITLATHANNNRFGAWTQIVAQAVLAAAYVFFDPNQFMVIGATANRLFVVEVGYGDGTVLGTTIVGRTMLNTNEKVAQENPVEIRCEHTEEDGASNLYMRIAADTGGSGFDTLIEIHPYTR